MIFLWPIYGSLLLCGLCAIFTPGWNNVAGAAFLVTVAVNMAVLTFDFLGPLLKRFSFLQWP